MRWRASRTSFSLGGHRRSKDQARGGGERDERHSQGEFIGDVNWIRSLVFMGNGCGLG